VAETEHNEKGGRAAVGMDVEHSCIKNMVRSALWYKDAEVGGSDGGRSQ